MRKDGVSRQLKMAWSSRRRWPQHKIDEARRIFKETAVAIQTSCEGCPTHAAHTENAKSTMIDNNQISDLLKRVRPVIDQAIEDVKQNGLTYCIRPHAYASEILYCIDEDGYTTISVLIAKANDHEFCQAVWRAVHKHEVFADVGHLEVRSEW